MESPKDQCIKEKCRGCQYCNEYNSYKSVSYCKEQNIFYKDLALLIKQFREDKNISQGELSRRVGVNPSAISKIESGKGAMLADSVLKIAIVLSIPSTELRFLARRSIRQWHRMKEYKKDLK